MAESQKIRVGIIGAGTMGSGIAQVAAAAGHETVLFDVDPAMVERARQGHRKTLDMLVEKGKMTQQAAVALQSCLIYAESHNQLADCGLVIEAIVENLEVKQKLFNDMEKLVGSDCILATNTSSLSVTSIASVCNDPSRVAGIHFFNPAPRMPLVEIVGGVATSPSVLKTAAAWIAGWGKTTVLAKDTPGFIVNRIARPFYGEAIRIAEEGIADYATIDWAMREHGFSMGPFELMDLIGNDVNYTVTETVWRQFYFDPRYTPSLTQKRLFEAGRHGRKSGRGYYLYGDGAVKPPARQDAALGEQVFLRILAMLINAAVDALYLGVASREDIDLAMTRGVNYPKGLLAWCDELGAGKVLSILTLLRETYMEDRYRPSVLLRRLANEHQQLF
jgi:3-hydroxybutyryl-CoA dehydrogenase